jgi:hypothetical protein
LEEPLYLKVILIIAFAIFMVCLWAFVGIPGTIGAFKVSHFLYNCFFRGRRKQYISKSRAVKNPVLDRARAYPHCGGQALFGLQPVYSGAQAP